MIYLVCFEQFRIAAAFREGGAESLWVNSTRYLVYLVRYKDASCKAIRTAFFSVPFCFCFGGGGVVWVMDFVFWAPSVRMILCGLDRD